MNNNVSLKKAIIFGLSKSVSLEALKGNNLLLITAFGVIDGRPTESPPKMDKLDETNALEVIVDSTVKGYKKSVDEDTVLSENDGYLMLSDVRIRTSSNVSVTMPKLIVFYDQIIAASILDPNSAE